MFLLKERIQMTKVGHESQKGGIELSEFAIKENESRIV